MMTFISGFLVLLCLGSALSESESHQIHNAHAVGRIHDEYLILLHEVDVNVDEFAKKLQKISQEIKIIKKFVALKPPIFHVQVQSEEVIRKAFQLSEVKLIEANIAGRMAKQCTTDNTYARYWSLTRLSYRPLPEYGFSAFYPHANGGTGVKVYVLDSGINYGHSTFGGRAVFGTNTIGGSNEDMVGHGTACAGAAIGGTNIGIARGSLGISVKVLNDEGIGTTASIIEGINWTIEDLSSGGWRGVISISLAGSASETLDSAVASAVAANIPVVVAAGNDDDDACNYSPARASGAITVGATNSADELTDFSNWGFCVDILAPGSGASAGLNCSSCFQGISGTSLSCSYVAGSAARYIGQNPTATPAEVKTNLLRDASYGYIDLRGRDTTPNLLLYERCIDEK